MNGLSFGVLLAIAPLLNTLLCDGQPDESMSSVARRMQQQGRLWECMRPVIDLLFRPWGRSHGKYAFDGERLDLDGSPKQR
jgi:hypothetical protein